MLKLNRFSKWKIYNEEFHIRTLIFLEWNDQRLIQKMDLVLNVDVKNISISDEVKTQF